MVVVVILAGLLVMGTRRYLSHWQTTEGLFDYMVALAPNAAPAYNNRGIAYGKKRDYERAIQDCTKAIELVPEFVGGYCNCGLAYAGKSEYDLAILDFSKAIGLKPDYVEACQAFLKKKPLCENLWRAHPSNCRRRRLGREVLRHFRPQVSFGIQSRESLPRQG